MKIPTRVPTIVFICMLIAIITFEFLKASSLSVNGNEIQDKSTIETYSYTLPQISPVNTIPYGFEKNEYRLLCDSGNENVCALISRALLLSPSKNLNDALEILKSKPSLTAPEYYLLLTIRNRLYNTDDKNIGIQFYTTFPSSDISAETLYWKIKCEILNLQYGKNFPDIKQSNTFLETLKIPENSTSEEKYQFHIARVDLLLELSAYTDRWKYLTEARNSLIDISYDFIGYYFYDTTEIYTRFARTYSELYYYTEIDFYKEQAISYYAKAYSTFDANDDIYRCIDVKVESALLMAPQSCETANSLFSEALTGFGELTEIEAIEKIKSAKDTYYYATKIVRLSKIYELVSKEYRDTEPLFEHLFPEIDNYVKDHGDLRILNSFRITQTVVFADLIPHTPDGRYNEGMKGDVYNEAMKHANESVEYFSKTNKNMLSYRDALYAWMKISLRASHLGGSNETQRVRKELNLDQNISIVMLELNIFYSLAEKAIETQGSSYNFRNLYPEIYYDLRYMQIRVLNACILAPEPMKDPLLSVKKGTSKYFIDAFDLAEDDPFLKTIEERTITDSSVRNEISKYIKEILDWDVEYSFLKAVVQSRITDPKDLQWADNTSVNTLTSP